ncbi:50S ribosomal protein L6, partial [Candidatus Microgenomates bacterium]|nr:50S ribosomal protein L6 [Candidatus Microgenomates bacterium]
VGTGFNVKLQGDEFILKLGYSHQITVKQTEGVKFGVDGNTKMSVSGIDRQLVGQVAHQIKILKKPDAYKGKGIRYAGEVIKTKPGKKAKAA